MKIILRIINWFNTNLYDQKPRVVRSTRTPGTIKGSYSKFIRIKNIDYWELSSLNFAALFFALLAQWIRAVGFYPTCRELKSLKGCHRSSVVEQTFWFKLSQSIIDNVDRKIEAD